MFKKILLSIILIGFLASPAFAQTITENLDDMDTNLRQATDLMLGLMVLGDNYNQALVANTKIQKLVDGGQFDQIPLNVKQTLNQAWTALKNYIALVEGNENIMEAFGWAR